VTRSRVFAAAALVAAVLALAAAPRRTPRREPADLAFVRGAVYTVDGARSWAETVVVSKGRIVFVGTDAASKPWIGMRTRIVDLAGKMLLPGFHDSHAHPIDGGIDSLEVDLHGLATPEAVVARIRAYAAAHPEHVAKVVLVSAASDIPAACAARVDYIASHYGDRLDKARAEATARNETPDACFYAFNTVGPDLHQRVNDEVMFPDMLVGKRQDAIDAKSGLRNTGELGNALFGGGFTQYRFAHPERVTMPVLVLAGAADYAIGLPAQRALGQALPHARVVEYAGAGHFLYLDAPDRFTRDVTDFLATP